MTQARALARAKKPLWLSLTPQLVNSGNYKKVSCLNSKEKRKKEGVIVFQPAGRKRGPRDTTQRVKKSWVPSRSAEDAPLIPPPPPQVPKRTEGGTGPSRTFRQDLRNDLQFWVPPILRHSYRWYSKWMQIDCLFSYLGRQRDSQCCCSSHTELCMHWESARHSGKAKQSKTQRPWAPSLRAGIEEAALHLLNAASSP